MHFIDGTSAAKNKSKFYADEYIQNGFDKPPMKKVENGKSKWFYCCNLYS